jgi:hypothetical protein
MSFQTMHQIIDLIESEAHSHPSPMEFEMAYHARIACDRIRFAIKHIEQFGRHTEQMREASVQLLDALQRLGTVDRRFQARSRVDAGPQRPSVEDIPKPMNGIAPKVIP